jgi:hypothetical protein
MATVYTSKAAKNAKGAIFAPGKCDVTGSYMVFKLCENYAGHVRGGIAKTWRYIAKGLSLDEAKALMEKKTGQKLYS